MYLTLPQHKSLWRALLLTLGLFASHVQTVEALCYTFTTIDIPTPNGNIGTTVLDDINQKGEIVGGFTNSNPPHGYRTDKNRRVTTIAFPGARGTVLKSINNFGEITGWYNTSTFPIVHGFFRDKKGQFTTLDVPGSNLTEPSGINDRSQIVGDYRDASSGVFHGFLWDNGVFSTIDVPFPGVASTAAMGINRFGDIVGFYDDNSGGRHGFLSAKGVFTTIDVPDAANHTAPTDINNHGQIVGLYVDSNETLHGFLLDDGVFSTIDVPFANAVFTEVEGINDRGELVGRYAEGSNSHGFLATPKQKCAPDTRVMSKPIR